LLPARVASLLPFAFCLLLLLDPDGCLLSATDDAVAAAASVSLAIGAFRAQPNRASTGRYELEK